MARHPRPQTRMEANMNTPEYDTWVTDPSPDNMAHVIRTLEPTINSEVQRYTGSKPLLRSKAKTLAVSAVRSYDPAQGARLRSWVVTQMQPLSRYGQQLRPVHAAEVAIRQAAEVNRQSEELADELEREPTVEELADITGISVQRITKLRERVKPSVMEGVFAPTGESDEGNSLPGTVLPNRLGTAEEIVYESLDARDKQIFDWKTGKHGKVSLTNQDIAKRLGLTPASISQRSEQMALQIRSSAETA